MTEHFPAVAVIGGGRWARVIVDVLIGLLPERHCISIHSRSNADAMREWVQNKSYTSRISVSSELPRSKMGIIAAIVVNTARDHAQAALNLMSIGIPVLIEKPMTVDTASAVHLVQTAHRLGVKLAPALVFRYASYVQHFAKEIREAGEVTRVKMVWTDARSEARYEEQKTFDPSLPVFADVLPHIFSILETLMPGTTETTTICDVKCFEQSDHLNFLSKNVPLHVELARNSGKRVRSVEVETKSGLLTLDFSVEPGVIRVGATQKSAAPNWIEQKRPLATMIEAFLKFVDGETRDSRFDLEHVLLVQSLVDQIRKHK